MQFIPQTMRVMNQTNGYRIEMKDEIKEHAQNSNNPLFVYDGIEHQHTMKCLKEAIAEIEELEDEWKRELNTNCGLLEERKQLQVVREMAKKLTHELTLFVAENTTALHRDCLVALTKLQQVLTTKEIKKN